MKAIKVILVILLILIVGISVFSLIVYLANGHFPQFLNLD